MKTIAIVLCLLFISYHQSNGQIGKGTNQVIEGGKVVVELIKALKGKKDLDKSPGCKESYADLCVVNETENSITVILQRSRTDEKKEMVILPSMKECSLQIQEGVWTYDLRITAALQSIRKGDILVEGCQNMIMNIK